MIMDTNMRKSLERLLAMALSLAMLFSLLPMTAYAESDEIIAFEPLTEAVAKQAVPFVTSSKKLNLPAISVTVGKSTGTVTAFAKLSDEIRWQNTAQPVFSETVSGTVYGKPTEIPVTWQADHAYDAELPVKGLYVFDAVLDDSYILAKDVETPRITVYIPETGISAFRMGGGGTAVSPLEITTAHQLAEIAVLVNAGRLENFLLNGMGNVSLKLMNDLDLSAYGQNCNGGKGWVPIGNDAHPFKGSFDGDGHIISGLYIKNTNLDNAGLFGSVSGSSITSLSLSTVNIHAGDWVGAIAGYIDEGDIEDCMVSGTVSGSSNIGGVVGWVDTGAVIVKACSFAGMVSGSASWTGGVTGRVSGGILQHSYSIAAVSGSYWVGGVVGMVEDNGTVEYCYATGAVKGSECVGGIAGMNGEYCNLQNCAALNSDAEASTSDCGRVTGANYNGTLSGNAAFSGMTGGGSNKTADGLDGIDITAADIKADGSIATRFTDADGWTIENGKLPGFGAAVDMPVHIMDGGYFTGAGTSASPYEISTPAQLAKLSELVNMGDTDYSSKYYILTADIDLSAYDVSYNGGKGWVPIGDATNNFMGSFDGNGKAITGLYINDDTLYAAGLFGDVEGGTIENLSVNGLVIGNFCVGVLAGALKHNSIVENCHTTGSVNADTCAGGLVGTIFYVDSIPGGTISSCYSTAAVAATLSDAGGIVGGAGCGTIENCAALNPSVEGPSKVGRIVGESDPTYVTLTGNAAFSGMTVTEDGSLRTPANDASGIDGADLTADALQSAINFPFIVTAHPWTYEPGSLPGLFGRTEPMPKHITDKLTNFFAGGDGTQASPYLIGTATQLAKLAELVNAGNIDYSGKYYKLTDNIDLSGYGPSNTIFNSGKGWVPIGLNGNSFYGNFDGNGNTITGLYINDTSRDYAGLFGYITSSGNVHDLIIKNAYINAGGSTGIVAGYTSTSVRIERCFVSGTVKGSGNVGGVAGLVTDSALAVSQCAADVTVSGTADIGGVVGTIDSAVVQNCYATGNVSGTGINIGGIGGNLINGSAIKKCYATGSISSVSGGMCVGGIAGHGETIENCVALGKSVKGHISSTCRVTGDKLVSRNNYAFSAMTGSIGMGKTADNVDGADVTIAQANTTEFWTTAGNWYGDAWDDTLWTFTDGKLPILKNLPASLQSGDGGLYLTGRDIANATVGVGGPYTYTGSAIEPSLSVTFDGATLVKGADYTVTYSDNTNAGQATVTLSGIGNFTGAKTANFIIAPKALTTAVLTVLGGPFTYTGQQHKPNVTVMDDGKILTLDKDYELTYGTNINAGTTVSVSAGGKGNYSGYASSVFTIGRAELTVTGIAAKTYDGTTGASGLALTFQGLQNGEELGLGLDYVAAGMRFNSADVGTDKTVTGTVALNYTPKANNYSLANGTLSLTGQTINKAPVSDVTIPAYVAKNYATTLTTFERQVSAVLNDLTKKDLGSITWSIVSVDNDDGVLATIPPIGMVNFPLSIDIASVADPGKTATIKVTVSSKNYVDFAATMIVTVTAKTMVTIGGITTPNKTYDSTAYEPIGTVTVTGGSVPVSELLWFYESTDSGSYNSGFAPTNAGDYELTIVVPNSNANYMGSKTLAFTIEKRQITLTADNKSVIKGGSLPELTYTAGNLAPGKTKADALTTGPALGCPTFDANRLGSYPIMLTGGTTTDNYTITARTNGVLTVIANWHYDGSGGGSGGDGGSGNGGGGYIPESPKPVIPTDKQPNMPTVAKTNVSGTVKNGMLFAAITEQMVKDAIKAAQDAAKKSGKELDGIALDFNATGSGSYADLNATIDTGAIGRLKESGVKFIKIGSAVLDVTLDMGAIAELDKQSTGTVTVSAKKLTKLSAAAKKLIGNRPVFDITISYQKNGITEYVGSFGKGAVTLGIAYKAAANENKGNLFGVYIDKNGKPQLLASSRYENTGRLIFSRNSLSTYGVGYKAAAQAFTDTATHWAKDNIDFVVSRDLISGTSATTFAPNTAITRVDFLMALGRLSGADMSIYKASSFTDVKSSDAAMPYIEWAVKNKIVSGYGNGNFGPGDSITREQMAVMMVNYAKVTGYKLLVSKQAITFADDAKISAYAKDAVKAIQQTGVINGKDNNCFDPQGSTTRAEASTILRRLVEMTTN